MSFEKLRRFDFEHIRELLDRVERSRVNLSLQRGNVSSINTGQVRQSLLRQAFVGSSATQVLSEDIAQRHVRRVALPLTLHPRSILYVSSSFSSFDGSDSLSSSIKVVASPPSPFHKLKSIIRTSMLVLSASALCSCGQGASDRTSVRNEDAAATAAEPVTAADTPNGSEPDYVNIEAAAVQPILDDCRRQGLADDQCYQRTQAAAFDADAKADGQTTVSAADLYGAFLANEPSAEDKYRGPLLVTGVSGGVQRNSGLSGLLGSYTLTVIPGVQASISREDGASVPWGSKVTLSCGSVGYRHGVVSLGNCSLKSAAPITLQDNANDMSALEARTGAQ